MTVEQLKKYMTAIRYNKNRETKTYISYTADGEIICDIERAEIVSKEHWLKAKIQTDPPQQLKWIGRREGDDDGNMQFVCALGACLFFHPRNIKIYKDCLTENA